jgi:hypothetical protein
MFCIFVIFTAHHGASVLSHSLISRLYRFWGFMVRLLRITSGDLIDGPIASMVTNKHIFDRAN